MSIDEIIERSVNKRKCYDG